MKTKKQKKNQPIKKNKKSINKNKKIKKLVFSPLDTSNEDAITITDSVINPAGITVGNPLGITGTAITDPAIWSGVKSQDLIDYSPFASSVGLPDDFLISTAAHDLAGITVGNPLGITGTAITDPATSFIGSALESPLTVKGTSFIGSALESPFSDLKLSTESSQISKIHEELAEKDKLLSEYEERIAELEIKILEYEDEIKNKNKNSKHTNSLGKKVKALEVFLAEFRYYKNDLRFLHDSYKIASKDISKF